MTDRIYETPADSFKNKILFPQFEKVNKVLWRLSIKESESSPKNEDNLNIIATVLSYAFHLHKAKIFLRRVSKIGYIMGTCSDD